MRAIKPYSPIFAGVSLIFLFLFRPSEAGTILWTGADDGVSWNDAGNWSNSIPPGAGDNAVIAGVGTNVTIVLGSSVTVESLQCSASLNLSGGGLTLNAGPSQVTGNLTIGSDQVLSVNGSGATFTCPAATTADDGNFTVTGGATVTLPGLLNYTKNCDGDNWTIIGSNSVLSLPALTNLSGAVCNYPEIQVLAGGQLLATNLTTILQGPLTVLADGSNSLVNFPALQSASGEATFPVQFAAQNNGTVWIPQLTNAPFAAVTITSGGTMPTAQFQQLGGISLSDAAQNFANLNALFGQSSIIGVTQSFPSVTNFNDANISVSGGAVVTFPVLQNYTKQCNGDNWTVSGGGSVLSFPALTNLSGAVCNFPEIQVLAGGQLLATNLAAILQAPLTILADGSNSLVDFPALQSAASEGGYQLQFVAQDNGKIWIPQLTNVPLLSIAITSGGSMPTAQFQQLGGISLSDAAQNLGNLNTLFGQSSVVGVAQTFPLVTNFFDANISVSSGAVVTFPILQNCTKECNGDNWTVTGAGSVLSFPALTNLTGAVCSFPVIQALAGGQLLATNLAAILQAPLTVLADGSNSLVYFPALQSAASEGGYQLEFVAQNNGAIWIPQLTNASLAFVSIASGGTMTTAQFQQLDGASLSSPANLNNLTTLLGQTTITGGAQNFPSVTNFDDASISVSGGAVVTFPSLQNYTKQCNGDNWTVTGSNSVLSFPALTNLTGEACSYPVIQALAGGQLLATNLAAILQAPLTILADGSNSLVDLPVLQSAASEDGYQLQFVAQNNGAVWIPELTNAPTAAVAITSGGVMPTTQFEELGGITVSNATANFNNLNTLSEQTAITGETQNFPLVTNFNDGAITVSDGGVVTFPILQNYTKECNGDNWTVTGAGSVLSFPVLTNLTGEACSYPVIQATAGGLLLATDLTTIVQGPLTVLADGTGSVVNFSGLQAGSGENSYPLSFVAQNNGALLIPEFGEVNLVDITAQSAGQVSMNQVQGISGSSCEITSTGSGSVVDLSDLSAFSTPSGASSLTATNGGVILLNNNVFLLENVAINWSGSPTLPPATIAGNTLSLYGQPWNSYRVDVLDTRNPTNTWQLYTLVPLTNVVQMIGGKPEPWQEFRVYEFVANPPILNLGIIGPEAGQLVFYSSNNLTFEVQTSTNLAGPVPWQPFSAEFTMTNTFRIFQPVPATATEQFFRWEQF